VVSCQLPDSGRYAFGSWLRNGGAVLSVNWLQVMEVGPNFPEVIWSKLVAGYNSAAGNLYCKAVLNRNWTTPFNNLADHAGGAIKNPRHFGLRANFNASALHGRIGVVYQRIKFSPCNLSGKILYYQVVKTLKPLAFIPLGSQLSAFLNQQRLSGGTGANTFRNVMFDQLDTQASHPGSMLCNAGLGVHGATDLDMAIAEMADVEVFHLGSHRGEVGEVVPNLPKIVWAKLLASDKPTCEFFNLIRSLRGDGSITRSHLGEV
jgi:hypothetical protein